MLCVPSSTILLPSLALALASSAVGSSSLSPLMNTRSACESTLAALGGGSKVWLLVPSGTMPTSLTLSPATLLTMLVIGETVVTTTLRPSFAAPGTPEAPHAVRASAATAAAAPTAAVRQDRGQEVITGPH